VIADWAGIEVAMPDGAFYLWIPVADGWEFTERFAAGCRSALVSPGEFYGPAGSGFVRLAVVQPDEQGGTRLLNACGRAVSYSNSAQVKLITAQSHHGSETPHHGDDPAIDLYICWPGNRSVAWWS
jgi:hypothetical protein